MKPDKNWRLKSLEALEKKDFGDPNQAPTKMVKRCLELYKIPLSEFSVEDLRLMIGQQFALNYLIPLAIQHLQKDLLSEGDYFSGDLLKNVLSVNKNFWIEHKFLWRQINELIKERREELAFNKIDTTLFDISFNEK